MEWSALEYTCSGKKKKKHTEIVRQDQINARVRHEKQEPTKKKKTRTQDDPSTVTGKKGK